MQKYCPGSVFYLTGLFHILCTDSGSRLDFIVFLGVDFMYLVRYKFYVCSPRSDLDFY